MANERGDRTELAREIGQAAEAVNALALDADLLATAVEAFRAADARSFEAVLERAGVFDRCSLVCDWLCSKECVLVCLELCGAPPDDQIPDLRDFAKVLDRVTTDNGVLERVVAAVEQRDVKSWAALVRELRIERFCHLLCHWVCFVRCRLRCAVICGPSVAVQRPLIAELRSGGEAIRALAADERAFSAAIEAVQAQDCVRLQTAIAGAGLLDRCTWICEWVCSWRCIWLCWPLCLRFPLERVDASLEEIRAFALAGGRLASDPDALKKLVVAIEHQDGETFGDLVRELELEKFCLQVCHWVSFLTCRRFCKCVCPPNPETEPHWQQVEDFDIHPAPGTPGSSFSLEGYAGNPVSGAFVFGGGVRLRGNCPLRNSASGNSHEYRFMIGEWTWSPPGDDPTTMPSVPPAALSPVTQLLPTHVGYVFYTDGLGMSASHPVHVTAADVGADGWVRVDGKSVTVPMHFPPGSTSTVVVSPANFLRTFELLLLNTPAITAAHPPKMPGGLPAIEAGRSLTTTEQEPIRRYRLRFEVRDSATLLLTHTDTLDAVIFDNSPVIAALNLEELFVNACNPLAGQSQAHILYTVDHPHLRRFSIRIWNNTGTVHPPPAHSGSPTVAMPSGEFSAGSFFFRGGAGGPHVPAGTGGVAVDISGDPPCAYAVELSWLTRRYLALEQSTTILYCK